MKPLFRYTVGCCLQQGLDILVESINRTTKSLGFSNFDWVICCNGLTRDNVDFLKKAIGSRPITIFHQNWADCPIDDVCQTPQRKDGSYEWNGNFCGGTLWKICPPRMRMESHEIVMDNDIIILKKFPQIDEFLSSKKALILEEPIRFYGRYDYLFDKNTLLNSGLMGFPPGFDYGAYLRKTWEENGKLTGLSQSDEQALLTYSLNKIENIRIKKEQVLEFLARDYNMKFSGKEMALHCVQSNRIPNHRGWAQYKEVAQKNAVI